jgi:hypothetical protein
LIRGNNQILSNTRGNATMSPQGTPPLGGKLGLRDMAKTSVKGLLPGILDSAVEQFLPQMQAHLQETTAAGELDAEQVRIILRGEFEKLLGSVLEMLSESVGPHFDRLEESLSRILDLVNASTALPAGPAKDALRAAVVLTHAYLEDFLRSLAVELLPKGDEACLDAIPLAGLTGRADKFSLGKLVQRRGKTVDDLLKQSVVEYLERSNFNSTDEISRLLRTLGFEVSEHSDGFSEIAQMIKRRHQIVHRQDRVWMPDSSHTLQPIEPSDVFQWLRAVSTFVTGVLSEMYAKREMPAMLKRALGAYRAE